MKACILPAPAPIETNPLQYVDVPAPDRLEPGEVLIRVRACGVCRTDLHVVEGELPPRKSPVIPGHQVVGVVERTGSAGARFRIGDRVGAAWLRETCGRCEFCRSARENLCESAAFNGYTADGGYAEYMAAPEAFLYRIPDGFADLKAAPLLCAGIIGFRCLRVAGITSHEAGEGRTLGLYGFGAAAHVAIQAARFRGARVFVCRAPGNTISPPA